MAELKKTLVLGGSDNPSRYSFLAINKLRNYHHPVVAIGKKPSLVGDVSVSADSLPIQDLDTVTVYLNPRNQKSYYDFVLEQHPVASFSIPARKILNLKNYLRTMVFRQWKRVRWYC